MAQLVERRSGDSKVAGSRPSRGRQHISACAGYGNYIIHTLEHFHLNILRSVQLHNLTLHTVKNLELKFVIFV